MPRQGGESDKLGNDFEAVWTVDALIDVFLGQYLSLTVEAFGDHSRGVEFHLQSAEQRRSFHSLKRQKTGGDWSIADLCRKESSGRSILSDLFDKVDSRPSDEICFVSSTGANELRELAERAGKHLIFDEYKEQLGPQLQGKFIKISQSDFGGDETKTFLALKQLKVVLIDHVELRRRVDQRIALLFYRINGDEFDPGELRKWLAEFVVKNLGIEIDTKRVRGLLDDRGIGVQDWKTDPSVLDSVANLNRRYLNITETELINSQQIARSQVEQIHAKLKNPDSSGVLLIAPGGFGKSCVLAQVVARLSAEQTAVLCLRLDAVQPSNTTRQLGTQLDLPKSPAVVLAGVANNSPCVLVVDQLDAMSLVSGRNPRLWDVFRELCDEVRYYPNMKLLLACRDFDLQHDHRLRVLGEPESGYAKISLSKLTMQDVRNSLDFAKVDHSEFSDKQCEILQVPFHLLLFLQGNPTRQFNSVGELYDRYWERKRQNLRARGFETVRWLELIDQLTTKMSDTQMLSAPKIVARAFEEEANALVSEHMLVHDEEQNQLRFFHESFFDYAYALSFCASGKDLVEFLASTEQHLFRRAQVRQILAYRREHDFQQYLKDVRAIFDAPNVRFHLKSMVAAEFHRIEAPYPEEWKLLEPYVLEGELSRRLSLAMRGHIGWFDLLCERSILENWLASDDERLNNAAIWFLEPSTTHEYRSEKVASLLSPYVSAGDDWQNRLTNFMLWRTPYASNAMAELFLAMLRGGAFDDYDTPSSSDKDFWSNHHQAAKEAPRFIIDVLAIWFKRAVTHFDDGEKTCFLSECPQNKSQGGAGIVREAAGSEPKYFVETMLSIVTDAVVATEIQKGEEVLNRLWPYLNNSGMPFDIDEAVLLSLRRSMEWMAENHVDEFRRHATTIVNMPHVTFAYLLFHSWARNPQEFADECANYVLTNRTRLNIGYASWSGDEEANGESAVSRIALRAVTPHCSGELFEKLEDVTIGYCDEYEKRNPRRRGLAELLVLLSFDSSRLSDKARLRIEELERKFPDISDRIPKEDRSMIASLVGPPIAPEAAELMTDDQWISAMRQYDGSTDSFRGGPYELSWLLGSFAKKDRYRFAALVEKMPDDVEPRYFSAILNAIVGSYSIFKGGRPEAGTARFCEDTDRAVLGSRQSLACAAEQSVWNINCWLHRTSCES